MKKFAQFILSFIIIIVFLGIGLVLPLIFIYKSGKNFIEDVQKQTKNRALEIAIALDTMSGESFYYDNMISLSNVMAKIKEHTNIRNDPYKIKEIFLLDNENHLLAHNDIIKVAKDFQPQFDPEKYKLGQILFYGNPISIETIGYAEIQLPEEIKKLNSYLLFIPVEKILKESIRKYLPDLLANQFHVYSSVYPPDEVYPKGSLHIIIENQGIVPLVSYWLKQMFYISLISISIFFILFILFMILLIQLLKKSESKNEVFDEIIEIPDTDTSKEKLPEDELSLDYFEPDFEDIEEVKEEKINKNNIISLSEYQKKTNKNLKQKIDSSQSEEKKNTQKIVNDYENIIDALPLE
ncbi:MAG: hypothetical protein KatS3mg129_0529 [Leptospiraceae bacterium]|nr:MAG: hypothetical protein KatS3mg129_0529 [Leptospiraceae bacterium]